MSSSSSSSTSNIYSSSSRSQWEDLPRRLITVSIGAPFIIFLLSTKITCILFFQCVHLLCTIEWLQLVQSSSATTFTETHVVALGGSYYVVSIMYPILSIFLITLCKDVNQVLVYVAFSTAFLYLASYVDMIRFENSKKDKKKNDDTSNNDGTAIGRTCTSTIVNNIIISNRKHHSIHGLVFISIPFYYWIRLSSTSFTHTTYLLFIIWNTDTGALLAGRFSKMIIPKTSRLWYPLSKSSSSSKRQYHNDYENNMNQDIVGNIISKTSYGRKFIQAIKSISPSKSITGFVGGVILGTLTAMYLPLIMLNLYDSRIGYVLSLMRSFVLNIVGLNDGNDNNGSGGDSRKSIIDVEDIRTSGILDFDSLFYDCTVTSSHHVDNKYHRMIVGIVISITAIIGDLVESSVKRNAGRKDSGKLLPGHGGILDRFDSTFLAVVLYCYWVFV